MAQVDRNEVERKYLLDTFSVVHKLKILFGLFGDATTVNTNLLFSANEQWQPKDFIALALSREIKMKDVTKRDYVRIQEHVRHIVPASEYAKIDWKEWDFSKGKRVNGYFKNQLFFHPQALALMPTLTQKTAFNLLRDYIEKTGRPKADPYHKSPYGDDLAWGHDWIESYDLDIQYMASSLSVVFNSGYSPQERHEKFKVLKDFPLWQERGGGFMLTLIPAHRLADVVSYEMVFAAKDVEEISAKFGNFKEEELYKSLMYIQNILNNRSFDLRLFTDGQGEFTLR